MKYKKVRFLKYFNRPYVFVFIEIDSIFVFLGVLFAMIIFLTFTSIINPFFIMVISFISAGFAFYSYEKYKNESSKGFFKHLLYIYYIYKVNPKKFEEEVKRMDISVDKYYPNPNEKIFIE